MKGLAQLIGPMTLRSDMGTEDTLFRHSDSQVSTQTIELRPRMEMNCNALVNDIPACKRINRERGLSDNTLKNFNVGLGTYHFPEQNLKCNALYFPQFRRIVVSDSHSQCLHNNLVPVNFKVRHLIGKQFCQTPNSNGTGLFGLKRHSQVMKDKQYRYLIVTEGEFDAMAVDEATDGTFTAVSLPSGCNMPGHHILHELSNYERIILFLDWDNGGQRCAQMLYDKLKLQKSDIQVLIVKQPEQCKDYKDANDLLKFNKSILIVFFFFVVLHVAKLRVIDDLLASFKICTHHLSIHVIN
ncbi:hypothetical protein RFI_30233 [Reticulomyxa filosa]|uniref:Toprim domain-containing protein n=1 Tax=Reticulomyxa filosa TaxID=46433 RepID=X6LZV0_RETFI|nr:hypothetical protein RFI_30233 [Reticulomyxa filosa]|eukprot:ETO07159.1 hypothetical protein RFI_30233 [Reticulomyxa filosa]